MGLEQGLTGCLAGARGPSPVTHQGRCFAICCTLLYRTVTCVRNNLAWQQYWKLACLHTEWREAKQNVTHQVLSAHSDWLYCGRNYRGESSGLVQNWRKLQALLDFGFGALSTLMIHFGHPSTWSLLEKQSDWMLVHWSTWAWINCCASLSQKSNSKVLCVYCLLGLY